MARRWPPAYGTRCQFSRDLPCHARMAGCILEREAEMKLAEIGRAFREAGLEEDYKTMLSVLGKQYLEETMTADWLAITIRDLKHDL